MNTTPIALVGYGSMGKELERLGDQYGCHVEQIFSGKRPLASVSSGELNFDVVIDFSTPAAVLANTRFCAEHGKDMVIGTTGWSAQKGALEVIIQEASIGAVWGANFSVGVQMFMRIVHAAAALANRYDEYDAALHELHHHRKLDSPSGTALALAEILTQNLERKTSLLEETSHGRINAEALHVSSTRVGEIAGTHTVYFDSLSDTLELTHRARNRSGFAIGALRAARWVRGKQGFFDIWDVFGEL